VARLRNAGYLVLNVQVDFPSDGFRLCVALQVDGWEITGVVPELALDIGVRSAGHDKFEPRFCLVPVEVEATELFENRFPCCWLAFIKSI
jgi:hypothetical protein